MEAAQRARPARTRRWAATLLSSLLAIGGGVAAGTRAEVAAAPASQPNFIVVETDDQRKDAFTRETMPFTRRAVARRGTIFTEAMVTSPLCCPSRASFLTGSYAHNHGAWNSYGDLRAPRRMLASWLQRAGYRTAMVGKYLNHYDDVVQSATRPEGGWDQWRMLLEPLSYFDYDVSVNGRRTHLGNGPRAYQTTYLNRVATNLTRDWAKRDRPFFLWLTPHAPHGENGGTGGPCSGRAVPAPGDEELFSDETLPRGPSFNERDIRDKPSFMRSVKRLDRKARAGLAHAHRCRLASLREVDRGVKDLYRALAKAGELDETVILFTSDNGLFEGEHRLTSVKRLPYREAVEVPMAALIGNKVIADPKGRIAAPVANIDLAPTLLELAGATPCVAADECRRMDGRSLVPMLGGGGGGFANRALLIEMRNCRYEAIQASDQLYVEHHTTPAAAGRTQGCRQRNAFESYRLDTDPYQQRNRGKDGATAGLVARLHDLRDCSGIPGRETPPPPGMSYCE